MTRIDMHFQNVYQKYAKFYNFYFGKIMNPGRLKAIDVANLQPGEKVLEVGVGTGLSLPFYPSGVEVTGIDLSEPMLKRAKKLVKEEGLRNVKALEIMNAEELTFPDQSFDCIMAMHVSTVVGSPERFAREMRRVCKKGGRIIIVNYVHDPETPVGKISNFLKPYARYIGFRPDLTLDEFLRRTGLNVAENIPVNLFNIWNVLIVRN